MQYSTKPQKIWLRASANGAKRNYQPDNPKVEVDKHGKVTLPAKFSGTVKITITAAATNEYNAATKTITVTVPTVTNVTKATAGKGQITVQWKKNTTGKGYEIQYSTDKKFEKSAKTVKIKENSTVKTTIKKLNPGTWYVRIRTINGTAYSDWSKAKEVVVCPSTSTLSSVKWNKKKKVVNVSWKKNTTGKGYEIQYSTDKKFKKNVKKVKVDKNSTVKTTIKNLKKGTWYFRIRTVNGKNYSGWSKVKTLKIAK